MDGLDELSKRFGVTFPTPDSEKKIKSLRPKGDGSVAAVLDSEFKKLGYGNTARLSILGDVGRENAWNRDTIFKGHSDPKNQAYNRGIISWQGRRRNKLDNHLKQEGVYGRNDDEELRGMARFMDKELRESFPQTYQKLRNATSTYDASEALREYIKYVPDAPYNTFDPDFRVKNNAEWAKRAKELKLGIDTDVDALTQRFLAPQPSDFSELGKRFGVTTDTPTATSGKPFLKPEDIAPQLPPVNPTGVPLKTNATVMPPVVEQVIAERPIDVQPQQPFVAPPTSQIVPKQRRVSKGTPQPVQTPVSLPRQLTTDEKQGIAYSQDIDVSQVKGNKKAFAAKKALQEAGLTPEQANRAVQRLQKEGNILKGAPTNPNQFRVTLTYDDINWALGGDEKNIVPSVQEMMDVARARRQAEIPDAVPTITKPDSATERVMEEQLRANAQAGLSEEPSFLNTDDMSLVIEKMLDDPMMIWTGKPFQLSEEERRKVVDDNITKLIQSAGSATKAKAIQDEAANMGVLETIGRSYRDLTDAVKRAPATFARTAAWMEEATQYLQDKGLVLGTTPTQIADTITWLVKKTTGGEYAKMEAGTLPNTVADLIEKAFPDDPVTRGTMTGKLSRAIGSSAPLMLGAMMTGGGSAAVAILGAAQQTGDFYKQAKDAGLSQEKRLLAGLSGIPIGASEALGLKWAKVGELLQKQSGGQFLKSFSKWAIDSGKEMTEEAVQEYFQSTSGKLLMDGLKNDGLTKKDVAKALGSSLDDAVTGGIVGLMFGAGTPLVTGNVGADTGASRPVRQSKTDALLKTEVPQKTDLESPTLKMGDKITPVSEMKARDNSGNFEPPVKEEKPQLPKDELEKAIIASSEEVAKADAELETSRRAEIFETAKTALSLPFIEPKELPTKAEQAKVQKAMAGKYEFTDVDENGDEFTDTYTGFQRQKELKKRSKSLDTLLKCLNG